MSVGQSFAPRSATVMTPGGARHDVIVKRAREQASAGDGMRVLVDRLWPRGVTREGLVVDLWLTDIAPTPTLRRWYGHDPKRASEFAAKYRSELRAQEDLLNLLDDLRLRGRLALLCDASDSALSHGSVLRAVLIEGHFLRQDYQGEQP